MAELSKKEKEEERCQFDLDLRDEDDALRARAEELKPFTLMIQRREKETPLQVGSRVCGLMPYGKKISLRVQKVVEVPLHHRSARAEVTVLEEVTFQRILSMREQEERRHDRKRKRLQ